MQCAKYKMVVVLPVHNLELSNQMRTDVPGCAASQTNLYGCAGVAVGTEL